MEDVFDIRFKLGEAVKRINEELQLYSRQVPEYLNFEGTEPAAATYINPTRANHFLAKIYDIFTDICDTIMQHKEDLSNPSLSYSGLLSMLWGYFKSEITIMQESNDIKAKIVKSVVGTEEQEENRSDTSQDVTQSPKFKFGISVGHDKDANDMADKLIRFKLYLAERYIISDGLKKSQRTVLYMGIYNLTDDDKANIIKSRSEKNEADILSQYFVSVFGIGDNEVLDKNIYDMTFGSHGIGPRMEPYFSLDSRKYKYDDNAEINSIKLKAYLKGIELKYGSEQRRTRSTKPGFYINELFEHPAQERVRYTAADNIYSSALTQIIYDIRKSLPVTFIMDCYNMMIEIDVDISSILSLIQQRYISVMAEQDKDKELNKSIESIIQKYVSGNDDNEKYTVPERFYMYLLLFEKRSSLSTSSVYEAFLPIIQHLESDLNKINVGYLNNICVTITQSGEEYKESYVYKKVPEKLGYSTTTAEDNTALSNERLMVRAYKETIEFREFFTMHLNGLIYFVCAEEDSVSQSKCRRRIKENIPHVVNLIKSVFGNNVDALNVYISFYLYHHLGRTNIRKKGYHIYDTKSLVRVINSQELSETEVHAIYDAVLSVRAMALSHSGVTEDNRSDSTIKTTLEAIIQILNSDNIPGVYCQLRHLNNDIENNYDESKESVVQQ